MTNSKSENNFENDYPPSTGGLQDWINSWSPEDTEDCDERGTYHYEDCNW